MGKAWQEAADGGEDTGTRAQREERFWEIWEAKNPGKWKRQKEEKMGEHEMRLEWQGVPSQGPKGLNSGRATRPLSCQGCLVGEQGKPIKLFNLSPPGSFPPATNESHSFLLPIHMAWVPRLGAGACFPGAVSLVPYKGGLFPFLQLHS